MKTVTELMGDQLNALRIAKQENFGGIPDDYRQTTEEILAHSSASLFMLVQTLEANKGLGDFVETLKEMNLAKILDVSDDDEKSVTGMLVQLDGSKKDLRMGEVIRKNWQLFEPVFLMFYIGMKVGQQKEQEEQEALRSIARAEISASGGSAAFLPGEQPVSAASALSPEKTEAFRRELDAELKRISKAGNDGKKDN